MESSYPTQHQAPAPATPHNSVKKLLYIAVLLVVSAAAAGSTYVWQRSVADSRQKDLQGQIDSLKKPTTTIEATKAEQPAVQPQTAGSTYKSKVGGLTLTLPSPYVVIVNVDGNKGGAPGATVRVATRDQAGIIQDNVYDWTQIELAPLSGTLDQNAQAVQNELKQESFENIKITDTTYNGQPAKLITANGMGYNANRRIYITKSGDYYYRFTSKTQDTSKNSASLQAALDGAKLEAKTF